MNYLYYYYYPFCSYSYYYHYYKHYFFIIITVTSVVIIIGKKLQENKKRKRRGMKTRRHLTSPHLVPHQDSSSCLQTNLLQLLTRSSTFFTNLFVYVPIALQSFPLISLIIRQDHKLYTLDIAQSYVKFTDH